MPKISVDGLLVSITHVAGNEVAITKILEPIWAPRTIFWVFRGGFCGNLDSVPSIVRFFKTEEKEKKKKKKKKKL
jgi:hypothetical protein